MWNIPVYISLSIDDVNGWITKCYKSMENHSWVFWKYVWGRIYLVDSYVNDGLSGTTNYGKNSFPTNDTEFGNKQ